MRRAWGGDHAGDRDAGLAVGYSRAAAVPAFQTHTPGTTGHGHQSPVLNDILPFQGGHRALSRSHRQIRFLCDRVRHRSLPRSPRLQCRPHAPSSCAVLAQSRMMPKP